MYRRAKKGFILLEKIYELLKDKIYKGTTISFIILLSLLFAFLVKFYSNAFYGITGLDSNYINVYQMSSLTLEYISTDYFLIFSIFILSFYWFLVSSQSNETKDTTSNNTLIIEILIYLSILLGYFLGLEIHWHYLLLPFVLLFAFLIHHFPDTVVDLLDVVGFKVTKNNVLALNAAVLLLAALVGINYSGVKTDKLLFVVCLLTLFWFLHCKDSKQTIWNFVFYFMLGLMLVGSSSSYFKKELKTHVCKEVRYGAYVVGERVFYAWKIYQDDQYIWLKNWDEESPVSPANLYKINVSAISYIDDYSVSGKIDEFKERFKTCM